MGHYIKDSWAPPTIATLHWDGKLVESYVKNVYLFYYQVYASIGYSYKPLYYTLIVLFFSYQLGEGNLKLLHVPIVNKATGENI